MSFRDRMKVKRSNAEEDVQIELQSRGINVLTNVGFPFTKHEIEMYGVKGTEVDGQIVDTNIVYFLDGPPHLSPRQSAKDKKIKECLERERHLRVRRYPYTVPLRKRRKLEIVADIENEIRKFKGLTPFRYRPPWPRCTINLSGDLEHANENAM